MPIMHWASNFTGTSIRINHPDNSFIRIPIEGGPISHSDFLKFQDKLNVYESAESIDVHQWTIPFHNYTGGEPVLLDDTVWTDLRFPATAINPPGQISDPDWDAANIGWLFDPNGTELLFIIAQMPHTWAVGTDILPHVHWIQEQSGVVLWRLEYKWMNVNALEPASFIVVDAATTFYSYGSGNLSQVNLFEAIDGADKLLSSILLMRLSRIGGDALDTYSIDARMLEFDIHYQINSMGSNEPW